MVKPRGAPARNMSPHERIFGKLRPAWLIIQPWKWNWAPTTAPISNNKFRLRKSFVVVTGFEVLTAVVTFTFILWDITPRSQMKVNRRFGGTCLHLRCRRISQARNQLCLLTSSCWLLARLVRLWRCRRHFPPKRRLTFNGLHDAIVQKKQFFVVVYFND
jgi:hypothetical protein